MSGDWYYSEGDEIQGPIALAELKSILARASAPAQILVWRSDFDDWQPAGLVGELVSTTRRPPPLRRAPIVDEGPPQPKAPLDTSDSPRLGASATSINPPLKGIGGWLGLLAIVQILTPLRFAYTLIQYYSTLDYSLFRRFPIAALGEAAMNVAMGILCVYTSILFFRTSRNFRRFFVWQLFAAVFMVPINAIWVALAVGVIPPIGPKEIGPSIAAAIVGTIWILYLFKSKRVANTFVR